MDMIGFTLSFLALSLVGFVILSDKRIRTHPNGLIAFICLSDAYNYFQILSRYIYCGYGWNQYLDQFFTNTVLMPFYYVVMKWFGVKSLFGFTYDEMLTDMMMNDGIMYGSTTIRLSSWYFLSIMVSYMSLFFSTSIILDLYYVLMNPFSSTEARIKKFTILTVVFSLICSGMGLWLTLSTVELLSNLNLILFISIAVINILMGVVIMIFVFFRFRNKGMSKNIKDAIKSRYLEFIVVYSILEGPFIFWSKPSYRFN
jgi:hypothetical protein